MKLFSASAAVHSESRMRSMPAAQHLNPSCAESPPFSMSCKHILVRIPTEEEKAPKCTSFCFHYLEEVLLICVEGGLVYSVNLVGLKCRLVARVPEEISCCLHLPTGSSPSSLLALGLETGRVVGVDCVSRAVTSESSSAHSQRVLGLCGADGVLCSYSRLEAFIWDCPGLQLCRRLVLAGGVHVLRMSMSSAGQLQALFGDDRLFKWNLNMDAELTSPAVAELAHGERRLRDFIAEPGRLLVVGESDRLCRLDAASGAVCRELPVLTRDDSGHVSQLLVYPGCDGVLAMRYEKGAVVFMDVNSGDIVQELSHRRHKVLAVQVSSSGLFFACCLSNGFVCLHRNSGRLFKRPPHKPEPITSTSPPRMQPLKIGRGGDSLRALKSDRLVPILRQQGHLPARYRCLVWRHLLRLPNSLMPYLALAERGPHPAWRDLSERFPISDRALMSTFAGVLSSLTWWCPLLAEVQFLPYFAFPFCRLLATDPHTCTELLATVLSNWCRVWFDFHPFPPIALLGAAENTLAHRCPVLLRHYMELGVTARHYVWPLLETAFSEVLEERDWLAVWDHVLANRPSFLAALAVAFNVTSRRQLLACDSIAAVRRFFSSSAAVSLKSLVRQAYDIEECTPDRLRLPADSEFVFQQLQWNRCSIALDRHQLQLQS